MKAQGDSMRIRKVSYTLWMMIAGIALLIFLGVRYMAPLIFPTPEPKVSRPQPVRYSYFVIVDQDTGKTIAYISSAPVTQGDEYITGDNQRYVVTRLRGNKAYAKRTGNTKQTK